MSADRIAQLVAVLAVGVVIGVIVSVALMRPRGQVTELDPNRGIPSHQEVREAIERMRAEEEAGRTVDAGQPAAAAPGTVPDPSPPAAAALPRNIPPEHWAVLGDEHREWLARIASDLRTRDAEDTLLRMGHLARVGASRLTDSALVRRSQISAQLLRLLSPEDCAFVVTDVAAVHSMEAMGIPMEHPAMVEMLHMTVEAAWLEHTRSAPAVRLEDAVFLETMERFFNAVGPSMSAMVEPVLFNPSAYPATQVCEVGLVFFDQSERLPPPWGARLARGMIPE